MLSLPELQRGFGAAILRQPAPALAAQVLGDGMPPEARIGIYRNHYAITLSEALAATFPVVERLVGERFFAQAVRRFVVQQPPAGPCLFEYGGELPLFLARLPECRALPYLADVARFEWSINAAWHAPDAPPLDIAAIAEVPGDLAGALCFRLHPSVRLLDSVWPVLRIWQANQPGAPEAEIALEQDGVALLIWRQADEVRWRALDPAELAFVRLLGAGHTLGYAALRAAAAGEHFDLALALARLIGDGAFTHVNPTV